MGCKLFKFRSCSTPSRNLENSSMELRSRGRKLSFDVLSDFDPSSSPDHHSDGFPRSNSDPIAVSGDDGSVSRRNRKRTKKNKKKKHSTIESISMDSIDENVCPFPEGIEDERLGFSCQNYVSRSGGGGGTVVCQELGLPEESLTTVSQVSMGELRQRSVSAGAVGSSEEEPSPAPLPISVSISWAAEIGKEESNSLTKPRTDQPNGKLQTEGSLDWRRLMADDPNHPFLAETSPFRYFVEEIYHGNSLKSTTTLGNEKERERVYDTIFRLPWRCEWLINVGYFVCLNSFLSLFTIMPMRILTIARRLLNTRELKKLSTAELSDFGCLVVLACGVMLLGQIDISLIYHMIRGQGIVKLYVVYNVLEIFDRLGQSISGDILETLFCSADGLAGCPPESSRYWVKRYIIDLIGAASISNILQIPLLFACEAICCYILTSLSLFHLFPLLFFILVHSFILLAQAITLSTCIVAHNNALLALLVSNNFSEIKSNVFKRFSKDNIHSIAYSDSVERFHISAFLLFVLAQNILEAEGSWFGKFLSNALLVYLCEMAIDILKHSFMAKFNDIKPVAYSEFLEDLCRQTLNHQTEGGKKKLTFVPLASASVVIRVLTPVYAAYVPCSSLPWRLLWILILTLLTYIMLVSLKVLVGMALQKHAAWYIKRCQRRKLHSD